MAKAIFVTEITVVDPDTQGNVQVSVYKHPNGGMFGIDSSYLESITEDNESLIIPDPFYDKLCYMYIELSE
jgi:hypothetical protein